LGASARTFEKPLSFDAGDSHFHLAAVFRMAELRRRGPAMLRAAKEAGLGTSVDTQWDHEGEWLRVLAPGLADTDLLFVNEDEGTRVDGRRRAAEMAHSLRSLGANEVVVQTR